MVYERQTWHALSYIRETGLRSFRVAVLNLDLADYDPVNIDLGAIPPGDYEVLIVDSRLRQSLALLPQAEACPGRQSMSVDHPGSSFHTCIIAAEFEFVVIGPVCKGARLKDSFTLCEETSMRRMKTLVVAARCPNPDFICDTMELHGLRCRVRVESIGGLRSPGCKNVISGYMRSGTQFPLRGSAFGASPFAPRSLVGQLIAERV